MFKIYPRAKIYLYKGQIFDALKLLISRKNKNYRNQFMKKIKNEFNLDNILPLSSARSGLFLAFNEIKKNDNSEVIISSFNAPLILDIFNSTGIKPVFVDVNDTTTMNYKLIEEKINENTVGILITHNEGIMCDMENIIKIAKKHKIRLIEDCAHTINSKFKNNIAGTMGDYAIYSLNYLKPLNTFGGGLLRINNKNEFDKIYSQYTKFIEERKFKILKRIIKAIIYKFILNKIVYSLLIYPIIRICRLKHIDPIYEHSKEGISDAIITPSMNKLSNIQAYMGIKQIKIFKNQQKIRTKNKVILDDFFKTKGYVNYCKHTENNLLTYSFKLKNRDLILENLIKKGIDLQRTWLTNCDRLTANNVASKLDREITYINLDLKTTETKSIIKNIENEINKAN